MSTGKDPYLCLSCGVGEMVIISMMPAIRGSPIKDRKLTKFIFSFLNSS